MKNLLIILVALIVCAPVFVSAQEPVLTTLPEPEPSEFEYPTLSFGNVSASQEGNEVNVVYQVGSVGGIVPDAQIGLALRTANDNGALTIVDEQVVVSGLTLGPENSPIMSVATYTIPPYLSGTYELIMLSRAQNGRLSAFARVGEVTVIASVPLTTTCTLDGQATTERPTITLGEVLTLSCLLKNTGTEPMTLEPSFLTKVRSVQGNPVATGEYTATPIALGAGEERTVTLEVPPVSQPEGYAVVATFTDTTTNTVVGAVPFSYLVEGPRAHFTDLTFDRLPVLEGDTMNVYAAWSIIGASLYPATLQASIGDATGACSNFVNESVTANTNTLTVPLTLTRLCPDGKLSVSLVQTDVKTLATKTYALALKPAVSTETTESQPTTEAPVTPTQKSNAPLLVSFLLLLLVVAIVGYLMNRNKKPTPPPTILPLFFLLIASVLFFAPVQKTEAANVAFQYNLNCAIVSPCTDAATIWYSYSTDKNTYSPGEAITITLTIASDDYPYAPVNPYASFTVSGGSPTGDLVSASLSAQNLIEGTIFSLTHSNLRAPMTAGPFTINVASGASGQPYLNPAAKNITGLTVSVPTCSFSGTFNWYLGDGSQCSVGASYSNVPVGQTRTAYDSDASGNTFTGSITYQCGAGGWSYVTADCAPNYSCQGSIPANASAWDSEESSGLSNNTTSWSYAASDTSTKCQYRCGSGYTYSAGTCVATSAYPNLSAAPPTLSTGSVQQNSTISFTGTITNIGSIQAGSYSNGVFYIDANGDDAHEYTVSASAVTNTTAAGDSRTTTGSWTVPATAPIGSNYRVGYYADVNNNVDEGVGDGPWANWSGWSGNFSVTSAGAFSCTGSDPANANLCSGDNTGLSANTAKTVVNSCTAGTKCEFTCGSGYTNSGGTCVAIVATSGDITATNCTIPTGAGNCQSTVSWTSSGITPSVRQDGLQFSTVASNNVSRTIGKGTTFFSIWDTSTTPETMEDAIGVIADCDVANTKYNNITGLCEANLKPTITASPQVVEQTNPASNSTISWTLGSYLAADCSLGGPGLTAPVAAFSQSIPITARSIFTITCGNAPPVSASVTIELRPQGFET